MWKCLEKYEEEKLKIIIINQYMWRRNNENIMKM